MIRKFVWLLLFLPFIEFTPGTEGQNHKVKAYNNKSFREIDSNSLTIAVIGDLQRTSFAEVLINREQNDSERLQIVNSVSNEDINGVVLLGDLVFEGSDIKEWEQFDKLVSRISGKEIPMFSIMGNHEYWGRNRSAAANVASRFPQVTLKKSWYCIESDSICMIFLDSNYGAMSEKNWNNQLKWFRNTLDQADSDPTVKMILVFMHHPPFSNSLITGDDERLQEDIVSLFSSSRKTTAMISGHAHSYERFCFEGKTFIISGGGGGPRINLNTAKKLHPDFCRLSYPRPFNYLLIERNGDKLHVTAKGLNKGSREFFIIESFSLDLTNAI